MNNRKLAGIILLMAAAVVFVGVLGYIMGKNGGTKNDEMNEPAREEIAVKDIATDIPEVDPPLPELSAHAEDDYELSDESTAYASNPEIMDGPGYGGTTALADSADVPEDAELVDEYGMYRVPMEWAAEMGGLYVERNGGYYALTPMVPRYVAEKYGVGYAKGSSDETEMFLYLYDDYAGVPEDIPTETRTAIISAGDFPILEVSKNERIIYFDDGNNRSEVIFDDAPFVGYTVEASYHVGLGFFPIVDSVMVFNSDNKHDIGIYEPGDIPVADIRKLEYGKKYLYEWFTGMDYHEMELVANCRCYFNPGSRLNGGYKLPLELTKNGYATVDISELEPGTYVYIDAVFEIVD